MKKVDGLGKQNFVAELTVPLRNNGVYFAMGQARKKAEAERACCRAACEALQQLGYLQKPNEKVPTQTTPIALPLSTKVEQILPEELYEALVRSCGHQPHLLSESSVYNRCLMEGSSVLLVNTITSKSTHSSAHHLAHFQLEVLVKQLLT